MIGQNHSRAIRPKVGRACSHALGLPNPEPGLSCDSRTRSKSIVGLSCDSRTNNVVPGLSCDSRTRMPPHLNGGRCQNTSGASLSCDSRTGPLTTVLMPGQSCDSRTVEVNEKSVRGGENPGSGSAIYARSFAALGSTKAPTVEAQFEGENQQQQLLRSPEGEARQTETTTQYNQSQNQRTQEPEDEYTTIYRQCCERMGAEALATFESTEDQFDAKPYEQYRDLSSGSESSESEQELSDEEIDEIVRRAIVVAPGTLLQKDEFPAKPFYEQCEMCEIHLSVSSKREWNAAQILTMCNAANKFYFAMTYPRNRGILLQNTKALSDLEIEAKLHKMYPHQVAHLCQFCRLALAKRFARLFGLLKHRSQMEWESCAVKRKREDCQSRMSQDDIMDGATLAKVRRLDRDEGLKVPILKNAPTPSQLLSSLKSRKRRLSQDKQKCKIECKKQLIKESVKKTGRLPVYSRKQQTVYNLSNLSIVQRMCLNNLDKMNAAATLCYDTCGWETMQYQKTLKVDRDLFMDGVMQHLMDSDMATNEKEFVREDFYIDEPQWEPMIEPDVPLAEYQHTPSPLEEWIMDERDELDLATSFAGALEASQQFILPEMIPELPVESNTLAFQQAVLKIQGKWTDRLLTETEFEAVLQQDHIRQQDNGTLQPLIEAFTEHLKAYQISLSVHVVSTIVTNIISIIALTTQNPEGMGAMKIVATLANVLSMITTILGACSLYYSTDVEAFVRNMVKLMFDLGLTEMDVPSVDGASAVEIEECLSSSGGAHQQDLTSTSRDASMVYGILRNHFQTPKRDIVTVVVNSLSWVVSIVAIVSIRAFGWNLRDALTHLTFLKYARELQQNLAKDVKEVTEWAKEFWTKPKEAKYRLLANRIARCDALMAEPDIDIVCDPSLLAEWEELIKTNPQFMATPQEDDGLKNLRTSLSHTHIKMNERAKSIQELARARGLRPVPVALHLWSEIGGVGKSSFVTNRLVPALHKIVGSAPGSEIWLKLSTENKYFPLMGVHSKICVVDEFLTMQDKDPVLAHLNGMISETPYHLDGAFEKNQSFNPVDVILMSNIPGCRIGGENLKMNVSSAIALWGRLLQFQVINVNRPTDQSPIQREFEHDEDFADLRFLPGIYVPEHSNLEIQREKPEYPYEISQRLCMDTTNWVPMALNGKWWYNAKDLIALVSEKTMQEQHKYLVKLSKRKMELKEEAQVIESIKIRTLKFEPHPWNDWASLSMSDRTSREGQWQAALVTEALHEGLAVELIDSKMVKDIILANKAAYLHGQFAQLISKVVMKFDVDAHGLSIHKLGQWLCLGVAAQLNIVLNNTVFIDINGEWSTIHIDDSVSRRWWVSDADRLPPVTSIVDIPDRFSEWAALYKPSVLARSIISLDLGKSTVAQQPVGSSVSKQQTPSSPSLESLTETELKQIIAACSKVLNQVPTTSESEESEARGPLVLSHMETRDFNRELRAQLNLDPPDFWEEHLPKGYEPKQKKSKQYAKSDFMKTRRRKAEQQSLENVPSVLRPIPRQVPKFSVYMFGEPGAGKTYYADQLARGINAITGFPIVYASISWWNAMTEERILELQQRPHIVVSDDSCFNAHFINVYDMANEKTIFINTSNEQLKPITSWNRARYACNMKGLWNGAVHVAKTLKNKIMQFETTHPSSMQMLAEGIVRRIGLSVNTLFRNSIYEPITKHSMTIEMRSFLPMIHTLRGEEKLAPSQGFETVWKAYNSHLRSIGEIRFEDVQNHDQVIQMLGNRYVEAGVVIRARNFESLQQMLLDTASIFRHYTNVMKAGDIIYVAKDFLKDPGLSISNPQAFLMSVRGEVRPQDLVEQGVRMYTYVARGSTRPAVRIICGDYDIYCCDHTIYVNREHQMIESTHSFVLQNLIVSAEEHQVSIPLEEVWQVVAPDSVFVPTDYPAWVISHLKIHSEEIRNSPQIFPFKQIFMQNRGLQNFLLRQTKSWNETIQEAMKSPYWKVITIGASIATIVSAGALIWSICKKKDPEQSPVQEPEQRGNWEMNYTDDSDSDWEDEIDNEDQSYDPKVRQSAKAKKSARMKQRVRGDFGRRRHKGTLQYMVRGCKPVMRERKDIQDSNFSIEQRIEDAIVKIINRNGTAHGYGLVLADDLIVCPAHFCAREDQKLKPDNWDLKFVEYMERGTGQIRKVRAEVYRVRRDLELMLLRVTETEKKWQRFPSIRQFICTMEDLQNLGESMLMVHNGDSFDRYMCSVTAHMNLDSPLVADDIHIGRFIRATWLSALTSTAPGTCGLPYVRRCKGEKKLFGIHVAANILFAYGTMLTQEIIDQLMIKNLGSQDLVRQAPTEQYIDSKLCSTLIKEDSELVRDFPYIPWMLEYSQDTGKNVAMLPLISNVLDDHLSTRVKVSEEVRASPNFNILGYSKTFDGAKQVRLRKKESPFSEIADQNGIQNPKLPSIMNVKAAPTQLKTTVYNDKGEPSGESIFWAQVNKGAKEHQIPRKYDPYLQRASALMEQLWSAYGRDPHRMLNDYEVRNGVQYGPYKGHTEGFERTTSPGLPFSTIHRAGSKAKYIGLHEVGGKMIKVWEENPETEQLLDHLDFFREMLAENTLPITLFKGTMKAELIDKDQKKARMFCASSIDLQYFTSVFYGTFAAAVKKYHPERECQVGVDPIKTLSVAWNQMMEIEGQCIVMDFKRWDKLVCLQLMQAVMQIIHKIILSKYQYTDKRCFGTKEAVLNALECLAYANIMPVICVEGVIYYTRRGLPSGSFMTTWLNSLCNSFITAVVVFKWQDDHALQIVTTSAQWVQNICEKNYGDDKVNRFSNKFISQGMCYSVFKTYADTIFGTETTPISKTGEIREFEPLEGIEFISRQPCKHNGGLWLNRLKKSSIEVLWHWLATSGDCEENAIMNMQTIMREALLWGEAYYNKHHQVAKHSNVIALKLGWHRYISSVSLIESFDVAFQNLELELMSYVSYFSPTAESTFEDVANPVFQQVDGTNTDKISQSKKLFRTRVGDSQQQLRTHESGDSLTVVRTQQGDSQKASNLSEGKVYPEKVKTCVPEGVEDNRVLGGVTTKQPAMPLPAKYRETPFPNDVFKTTIYLQMCDAVEGLKLLGEKAICTWCDSVDYQELIRKGDERKFEGYTFVVMQEVARSIAFSLALTIQLAGQERRNKVLNVMDSVCYKISELVFNKMQVLKYFVEVNPRTEEPQRIYVFVVPENLTDETVFRRKSLSEKIMDVSEILNSIHVTPKLIPIPQPRRATSTAQQSGPVGSNAPTMDAQAAKAAPSDLEAQVSNQQNNAALSFGNCGAQNRIVEGGMMIQLPELICRNWQQLYSGGGPLINVPVATSPGTVLFHVNIRGAMTKAMKLYALLHMRMYTHLQIMLNFIGTATWAGNVGVAVTPTEAPTGTVEETDNFLRTYAFEQKPLSSNGTQLIDLRRLIASDQSNVAWDSTDLDDATIGPHLYIWMATSYEQALNNPDTAFQIQIMTRFGPECTFGGVNWTNVIKAYNAIAAVTPPPQSGAVGSVLQSMAGLTLTQFLKSILGQGQTSEVSFILNGSTYLYQDKLEQLSTIRQRKGYSSVDSVFPKNASVTFHMEYNEHEVLDINPSSIVEPLTQDSINSLESGLILDANGKITGVVYKSDSGFSEQFIEEMVSFWKVLCQIKSADAFYAPTGVSVGYYGYFKNGKNAIMDYDVTETTILDFIQRLTENNFTVSYTNPTRGTIYTYKSDKLEKVNIVVQTSLIRASKDGVSDSVVMYTFTQQENFERALYYRLSLLSYDSGELPSYEIPSQTLIGSNLPIGYRRIEITGTPFPVNSTTKIPVAMSMTGAAFESFLSDQSPDNVNVVIDVWDKITQRKGFSLIFARGWDTAVLYFGKVDESVIPQHAVYNGASMDNLYVRGITTVLPTATQPASDPSYWTSIELSGTSLRNLKGQLTKIVNRQRAPPQSKVIQDEAITRSLVRILNSNRSGVLRQRIVSTLSELKERPSTSQQQEWRMANVAPKQVKIGQAARSDKETIAMIAGGLELGAIKGAAAGAGRGATAAAGARRGVSSVGRSTGEGRTYGFDHLTSGEQALTQNERDEQMRSILANDPRSGEKVFSKPQSENTNSGSQTPIIPPVGRTRMYRAIDHMLSGAYVKTAQVKTQDVNLPSVGKVSQQEPQTLRAKTSEHIQPGANVKSAQVVTQDLFDQQKKNWPENQAKRQEREMRTNTLNRLGGRPNRDGPAAVSWDKWLANRPSTSVAQGGFSYHYVLRNVRSVSVWYDVRINKPTTTTSQGIADSAMEAGMDKWLQDSAHSDDLETMKKYYENMSTLEKQKFKQNLEQSMQDYYNTSQLQQSAQGHETEMQGSAQAHETQMQGSEQQHETAMQEESLEQEANLQEDQQQHEKEMQEKQLLSQGNVVAALAGINSTPTTPTRPNRGVIQRVGSAPASLAPATPVQNTQSPKVVIPGGMMVDRPMIDPR